MTTQSQTEGVFTAGSQPFTTQDAALAFSLYLAGVSFVDPARPCMNLYDGEILKKLGFRGMTLEEAVRSALAANKKGEVRYIFARTPELNDLLNAYTTEQKVIADGEGTAAEHLAKLIPDDPALRLRVAAVALKLRPQFMNLWKQVDPLIRVANQGQSKTVETANGKLVSSPGFRVVSLNASEATRKKLRL
jgi:hypothetical protein